MDKDKSVKCSIAESKILRVELLPEVQKKRKYDRREMSERTQKKIEYNQKRVAWANEERFRIYLHYRFKQNNKITKSPYVTKFNENGFEPIPLQVFKTLYDEAVKDGKRKLRIRKTSPFTTTRQERRAILIILNTLRRVKKEKLKVLNLTLFPANRFSTTKLVLGPFFVPDIAIIGLRNHTDEYTETGFVKRQSLIIEVDGTSHEVCPEYDEFKDEVYRSLGFEVDRLHNNAFYINSSVIKYSDRILSLTDSRKRKIKNSTYQLHWAKIYISLIAHVFSGVEGLRKLDEITNNYYRLEEGFVLLKEMDNPPRAFKKRLISMEDLK